MIAITSTACIEASKADAWKYLSKIEDIDLWSEPVLSASCDGDLCRGVGAERRCHLKGGITITEKWIDWEEGESFTYLGFSIPLVKKAKNKWSLKAQENKTLLISEAEIELKGGFLGKLLEPILAKMTRRAGSDALAAFKYLVENGRPYEGSHSSLPRAALAC